MVLISGKMGSGKTTTADRLAVELSKVYPVSRPRFAGPLYEMHDAVLAIARKHGLCLDVKKDGALLQVLGTEWMRNTVDKNGWITCAVNHYKDFDGANAVVIIDDCRFKNELEIPIKPRLAVRLECPRDIRKARCDQWRENETHPSEVDLDDWLHRFDQVYDSSVMPVDAIVKSITEMVHERFHNRPGA